MNILRVKRKALSILERVEGDGAYLHLLLQQAANSTPSAPDEYPIVVQLVRGTLEQRGVIEDILKPLLSRGSSSLPLMVRLTLRMGAYQILFLERVNKRDVVFEAVELIKEGRFRGFAGLVNAVLRKIEPAHPSANQSNASLRNFPQWLTDRLISQFGTNEVGDFCSASDRQLPLYLRVNTNKTDRGQLRRMLLKEGIVAIDAKYSKHSLEITEIAKSRRLHTLDSFRGGLFYIQDLSSTIVADIVSSNLPKRVRDVCAAPGGKACSVALSILEAGGVVEAFDRVDSRVGLINTLGNRLDLSNMTAHVCDLLKDFAAPNYDAVLLDAPCSGLGTSGRKADLRWSKTAEDLNELVVLQRHLIQIASHYVKVGGSLIYSTCTIDRAENEDIVKRFIDQNRSFTIAPLAKLIDPELCTNEGFYRAWPHKHNMAGAFAACIKRTN